MSSSFTPSVVGAFNARNIVGDTTGTAVPAGYIGEERTLFTNSIVDIKNVTANIMSISLPAGVWDVTGSAIIDLSTFAGTAFGYLLFSVDTASGTLNDPNVCNTPFTFNANIGWRTTDTRRMRFSLSATTTVYLVGNCNLVSGTISTIVTRLNGCAIRAVRIA